MKCEATTKSSTYSAAHPCLKTTGLKKEGRRRLCSHHRGKQPAKTLPSRAPAATR